VPVSTAARMAVGAAALVFAVAGCGSGPKKPSVASAGGTPTATAGADAVTEYVEGMRSYVTCLRAEGVAVTDPDAKGRIEFRGDPRALKADPRWRAAQVKCSPLSPAMPKGIEDQPALTAEQIDAARRYARCMRENGATDFPDPGPDGNLPDSDDGKPLYQDTPAARRAATTCGPILGAPATPGAGNG
jgi:hypothetical protein